MSVSPFNALACPLDGAPLHREGAAWRCAAGHSFDIASQGYINLLPVQNKRSLDPGDSKEMVAARRRFLETGVYAPIAAAVCETALAHQTPGAKMTCLDAGCGEGYYLRQLALAGATRRLSPLSLIGLDISKWAVLAAAKRDRAQELTWLVGSNANLPVQSASLDGILCMFGFPVHAEFARVLKTDGLLMQVDAGPDHLRELREIIYPTLKAERQTANPTPTGFVKDFDSSLRYTFELTSRQQIADLLAMTPHLYRTSAEGRARAEALDALTLTADVRLRSLRRTS